MNEVSTFRLYVLRAAYLLIAAGQGSLIWPAIFDPTRTWALSHGVVVCMLGSLSALAILGLRYPLQMLPLLFWELTWKTLWLARVVLPLWYTNKLDAATAESANECLLAGIFLIIIPWGYVYRHYVRKPGDRWTARRAMPNASA